MKSGNELMTAGSTRPTGVNITTWQFMMRWLMSRQPEAPLLIVGTEETALEKVIEAVIQQGDAEIVELSTAGSTIAIEELRDIWRALARTSLKTKRLVIIPAAHRLSMPAAQALLKSLEESSASTRFLLTTLYPRRLLLTIRSRCQQVRAGSASQSEQDTAKRTKPSLLVGTLLQRMAAVRSGNISEQTLVTLALALSKRLKQDGPSKELKQAFLGLRDYYWITGMRSNEQLAKEVLMASLPEGREAV